MNKERDDKIIAQTQDIKQYLAKQMAKVKGVNILVYFKYLLYLCNKFKTHG